jgi:hypothetical protein
MSFSQDTLDRNTVPSMVQEVSKNNFSINSYKSLPKFIRNYLCQVNRKKFKISGKNFNATDFGDSRFFRKLSYIVGSRYYYILSYEHGGRGYHNHSIIFKTSEKKVITAYNLITPEHKNVSELITIVENGNYMVQTDDL